MDGYELVMTHGFGWLVLLYSFLPILLFMRFIRETRVRLAFLTVVAAHHVVAIMNTFVLTVKGGGADALDFHKKGEALAANSDFSFGMGPEAYNNMLGLTYWVFGDSKLVGAELSVIAFLLSCVLLVKFMDLLDIRTYRASVLLVFGLLPTALLHTSITLREAWEILFFMAAVYFGLCYQFRRKWTYIFLALLAAGALGIFHKGMAVFVLFLLPVVLLWPIGHRSVVRALITRPRAIIALVGAIGVVVWAIGGMHLSGSDLITQVVQGEMLEYSMQHRESTAITRATYDVPLDVSSPSGILLSFGAIVLHYMLEPFPWKITTLADVYGSLESMFRLLLFLFAWRLVRKENGAMKQVMQMLFILYIIVSVIWAVGTTNYGTAMRHHLVGFWIILVLGLPELMRTVRRFLIAAVHPSARVRSSGRASFSSP